MSPMTAIFSPSSLPLCRLMVKASSRLFPCSRLDFFDQQNFFRVIGLAKLHLDDFAVGGLNVAADIRSFNGQLAMPAINQHAKLNSPRPAVIKQRVESGARRAASVENVVAEDD